MKVIQLKSENIKNLKAVDITPENNTVILTGKNGAGKSSVLDSITYAFAGKESIPDKPIREGEKSAKIEVDCGDFLVRRTFTEKGSSLTILTKDGDVKRSPQKFLNDLVGRISFDPLEFINHNPKRQAEILADLVGVDVDSFDSQYNRIYADRTAQGRIVKQKKVLWESMPYHSDVPEVEVSISELYKQRDEIRANNEAIDKQTEQVEICESSITKNQSDYEDLRIRIKELQEQLDNLDKTIQSRRKRLDDMLREAAGHHRQSEDEVNFKIERADTINKMVRENQLSKTAEQEYLEQKKAYDSDTAELEKIAKDKENAFASVKFPIDGLSFGDDGVTFRGIPLDQISSAEKIKVGMSVSMALNPKLKVLRITDGSLLDSKSMSIVQEMAATEDYQVWIEKVDETGQVGIYIEEGEIKHAD